MFELIHFRSDHLINDIFIHFGLFEKPRQRMLYSIPDNFESTSLPSELSFELITKANIEHVAAISTAAHRIRHSVEGYQDFFNIDDRIQMETLLLNDTYNPYAKQSSFLMKCHQEYVGVCSAVVLDGWNSEKIVWIMDFSLMPQYQGFGYAKYFLSFVAEQSQISGYQTTWISCDYF